MSVFDRLFGNKSDESFTAFEDAEKTAFAAINAGSISRTDFNILRRCYNGMSDAGKQLSDLAMSKPIVEDGDGIFDENGYRIG